MQPPRSSGQFLPLRDDRRRRLPPLMVAGAVALVAGWMLDLDIIFGVGIGILVMGTIVLLLDARARRQPQR